MFRLFIGPSSGNSDTKLVSTTDPLLVLVLRFLVMYTILFNLDSYVIILFFIIKIGVKIELSTSWVVLYKIINIIKNTNKVVHIS
jgi:hypothetical protein